MLSNCNEKISVIIPAYNIADYLPRCLDSILNQTYQNLEVIVVNDGSCDDTDEVVLEYAKQDSRVHLISKCNEGVSKARLAGVSVSTGEWIGFVDGDDEIDVDMYERLLLNALNHNAEISHCGYKMVFPGGRIDYYYNTGKIVTQDNISGLQDLISGSFVEPGLWNKLFRKKLFHTILNDNIFDISIKYNEDLLMNYWIFKEAEFSIYEDFCPYHYVLRKGSAATSKVNENKMKDPLKVLKIIKADCSQNADLQRMINARISANLIGTATTSIKPNPELIKPYRKQIRKELRSFVPVIIKGNYSAKRKLATLWAAVWPWSYGAIHRVYGKLKGIDKKYDIN